MCTILLRWEPQAPAPLVLAANRDEFRERPSDPPGLLAPGAFGGRDRRAGGTWLAVGRGALAAVTNVSDAPVRPGAPSRGMLPLAALAGALPDDVEGYNAFNLLVVDAGGARVLTHVPGAGPARWRALDPGPHAIVNEAFGAAESPRVRHAARLAAAAVPALAALADHGSAEEPGLCHHGAAYGTVSATVVVLGPRLALRRYLHAEGLPCRAVARDFTRAARDAIARSPS